MTNKDVLERYLLGDVSDEERAEIEQGYFADDGLFDQLIDAQYDLVDAYAHGTLAPAERKKFEERLLASGPQIDRVEFARALQRKTARKTFNVRQLAIAASIAIVVIAAASMMFLLRGRPEAPVAQQSRPQVMTKQTPPSPVQVKTETAATLITVLLTPGGTRESEAAAPLVLRPAPQVVRVELVLEENRYDSYAAELQDVEGRVLWKETSLQPKTGRIALSVSAKLLPPGDYIVILQGIRQGKGTDINNYTFTVVAMPGRR